MGRGNVCVTGSYEGLFYIDNDDLRVWRKDGPDGKEPEIRMTADISLDELVADDWYVDEIESSYKEEDVLRCFCAELRKLCPSFQPAANSNVWLGNERRVILENELFYICVEDNEWSLAVELVQKDGYSDCQSAWLAGLQKRRYREYLDSMKKALLARLPSIGVRTGPWTHGTITREEAGVSLLADGKNIKAGWCYRRIRYDEEYRMPPDGFCSYGKRRNGGNGNAKN